MQIRSLLLNYLTPYKGLSHLFTGKNDFERGLLKVASCALAIFVIPTLVSHLYCQLTDRRYSLVPREPHPITAPALRRITVQRRSLSVVANPPKDLSCLTHPGLYMEYFLAVSPYKPCGYTEFVLSTEAQKEYPKRFPEKARGYGRERTASSEEIQKEMKQCLDEFARRHGYDNITRVNEEYRAVHPQSIYEICKHNRALLRTSVDEAKGPLNRLLKALDNKNTAGVARAFLELSQIENSLPQSLFAATFGDIGEATITDTALIFGRGTERVRLSALDHPLHALAVLHQEFPEADIDTLRNLCSYFYHEGFEDPVQEARKILPGLEPGAHYAIHESTAYKIPKGRIA